LLFILNNLQVDPIDFTNPKFLSTSNPRWVKAGLSQEVINVLSEKGITKFTPVQAEAFDPVVAGRDVIGRSRTGTGKTLAFGLPSMTRMITWLEEKGYRDEHGRMARGRPVTMVVMCPTRELARQVQEELASVARPLGLFTEVFHGGVSYDGQVRAIDDERGNLTCKKRIKSQKCLTSMLSFSFIGPCTSPGSRYSCRHARASHGSHETR
jgi:superfamily II DNA/RNA helicase